MKAVLLKLEGPLRSWGEKSFGYNRETLPHPTKSAILGLVGACVGVNRRSFEMMNQWYCAWDTLILSVNTSQKYMRDYQVTEGTYFGDRKLNPKPFVSNRYYIQDTLDLVAIYPAVESPWSEDMDRFVETLKYPVFTPYLGRRCNTLSAPLIDPDETWLEFGNLESLAAKLLDRAVEITGKTSISGTLISDRKLETETLQLFFQRMATLSDVRNGYYKTYGDRDAFFYGIDI